MLGIEPMSVCLSESIKNTRALSFLVNPFDPKPGQLKLAVTRNRLLSGMALLQGWQVLDKVVKTSQPQFKPKLKLALKEHRLLFVNTWNGTIANK